MQCDFAGKPVGEEDEGETDGKENDEDEDETLRFPPPYLIPNDPSGMNFGYENEGPSDGDEDKPVDPADDASSGFREELSYGSDQDVKADSMDSGVIETEMKQESVRLEETTPLVMPFSPPFFPPMYSSRTERRSNEIRDDGNSRDDVFGDVLAGARQDSDALDQNLSAENELEEDYKQLDTEQMKNNFNMNDQHQSLEHDNLVQAESASQSRSESADLHARDFREYNKESNNYASSTEIFKESVTAQESSIDYPLLPVVLEDRIQPLQLPSPVVDFSGSLSDRVAWNASSDTQDESAARYSESRRVSKSYMNEDSHGRRREEGIEQMSSALVLPKVGTVERRRVSVTRPVEITMSRGEFESFQDGGYFGDQSNVVNEISAYSAQHTRRRRSAPFVLQDSQGQSPAGSSSIWLDADDNNLSKSASFSRRSLSESNLLVDDGSLQMPAVC